MTYSIKNSYIPAKFFLGLNLLSIWFTLVLLSVHIDKNTFLYSKRKLFQSSLSLKYADQSWAGKGAVTAHYQRLFSIIQSKQAASFM